MILEDDIAHAATGQQCRRAAQHLRLVALDVDLQEADSPVADDLVETLDRDLVDAGLLALGLAVHAERRKPHVGSEKGARGEHAGSRLVGERGPARLHLSETGGSLPARHVVPQQLVHARMRLVGDDRPAVTGADGREAREVPDVRADIDHVVARIDETVDRLGDTRVEHVTGDDAVPDRVTERDPQRHSPRQVSRDEFVGDIRVRACGAHRSP